jgi:hypothetical protein
MAPPSLKGTKEMDVNTLIIGADSAGLTAACFSADSTLVIEHLLNFY